MLRSLNFSRNLRHLRVRYSVENRFMYSTKTAHSTKHVGPDVSRPPKEQEREEIVAGSMPQRKERSFGTLDPSKLQSSDHIVLAYNVMPGMNYRGHAQSRTTVRYASQPGKFGLYNAFPPEASGFFYYHPGDYGGGIDGQVQFRTTPTNDPQSFALGRDLEIPDGSGSLWQIPLMSIAYRPGYKGFRQCLLDSTLVPPALMNKCSRIVENSDGFDPARAVILHSFGAPFSVSLQEKFMLLWVIDHEKDKAHLLYIQHVWTDQRVNNYMYNPYRGTVQLAFERSALPEHADRNVVVLRILKILSPVEKVIKDYEGFISFPQEGELVTRDQQPWRHDVDMPKGKFLLPLFLHLKESEPHDPS